MLRPQPLNPGLCLATTTSQSTARKTTPRWWLLPKPEQFPRSIPPGTSPRRCLPPSMPAQSWRLAAAGPRSCGPSRNLLQGANERPKAAAASAVPWADLPDGRRAKTTASSQRWAGNCNAFQGRPASSSFTRPAPFQSAADPAVEPVISGRWWRPNPLPCLASAKRSEVQRDKLKANRWPLQCSNSLLG